MKGSTLRGRIRDVSSISHMTYHNGQPCDKYTATVKICQLGYQGAGLHSWYLILYGRTIAELEKKLEPYRTPEIIEIDTKDLVDKGGHPYGKARN